MTEEVTYCKQKQENTLARGAQLFSQTPPAVSEAVTQIVEPSSDLSVAQLKCLTGVYGPFHQLNPTYCGAHNTGQLHHLLGEVPQLPRQTIHSKIPEHQG